MKKKYRLKRNEEISKVVASRQNVKCESFILYYKKKDNNENIRVCVSVSKKNGNAVVRNKIKRQVREMVYTVMDFSLKYDIVVVIRQFYLTHTFEENASLLQNAYSKFILKETN